MNDRRRRFQFENQLNLSRQRCAQFDREKIHYQHLFDRETKQRELFEKKSEELHVKREKHSDDRSMFPSSFPDRIGKFEKIF